GLSRIAVLRRRTTMLKTHMAACLVATALAAAPAVAQNATTPNPNPPTRVMANVNAAEFVNQAANSGMFEIQSSELALNKVRDDPLVARAPHMVQDATQD